MDPTLTYCLLAGLALVFLYLTIRFALRWFIRIAIVTVILIVLVGAAWVWFNQSSSSTDTKPRSTSTHRDASDRQ